jgi:hypothetical protein
MTTRSLLIILGVIALMLYHMNPEIQEALSELRYLLRRWL